MSFYKRFIGMFFLIPIIIVFSTTFYISFFYAKPKTMLLMKTYHEEKTKLADKIQTKKIVFTSGSSTLYGINTIDIEKALNIPTINLAVNAGLNNDYIFYKAKEVLTSGDILIIPNEYHHLLWNGEMSTTRNEFILTNDREYFNTLPLLEKIKIINTISFKDIYLSIKEQYSFNQKDIDSAKETTKRTINKNGDRTEKMGYKPVDIADTGLGFPLEEDYTFQSKGLIEIVELNKWCKEHNITLFMTFPNTIYNKVYEEKRYVKYFYQLIQFYTKNNIQYIGHPRDFLYKDKYFYDTNYHLNTKGAHLRTQQFIELMKSKVKLNIQSQN